ncbi:TonB-dependent receptor domain-containing protein [Puniceibacterium sediminis]|uniref:Hemoglobin/transferrin/lactoferrin receptor protein n=1 Tax=Puniceibacterium sediminis TaxID=1608407 RepID=A0A238YR76_9RHOB|nr:TonB-dependent receptor [Puniceibacterium sediminis]SNR73482.1 hemoglobin/transferrin/lactoferrin receptor protein [Puniceibacterium sediminis]
MSGTHRRAALLGTSALLMAMQAGAANAQAVEGDFLGTVTLGESKREVQTDTATPVTVIDEDEITDRQAGTVAELIDSVPGVILVNGSTPQGSGINIRGFGANSTYGTDQKVAIQIDGASVGSEELYRIGTQLFTDPFLFKQVEVIRGTVGSFEYGSGIVGGVVRLETKDASDYTDGETGLAGSQTLAFGSNGDGLTSSTTLAWQPTQNVELLANYTWRQQDLQDDGTGDTIGSSDFELPSYMVKGKYSFGAGQSQYLSFSYTASETSDSDVPYDSFGTTTDAFGNVDRDVKSRTAVLSYGWNPADNDLIDLTVALSYADQQIDQAYVPGSSSLEGTPTFAQLEPLVNADHRYETTKLSLKNTSLFNSGIVDHELRTGLELIRKERAEASSAPGGGDNRIALFAVDDMRIGEAWTVTPALRYESSKLESANSANGGPYEDSAFMGGLSVRYAFGNGFAVFGSAAETKNLPILDDLTNATLIQLAERARTYELGASFDRHDMFATGDSFAIKGNVYSTRLSDVTSYTSASGGSGTNPDNIDTRGIEIEASYAMESGFYVDMNANIVEGHETRNGVDTDWRNTPADTARLTLGKKFGEELDLSWELAAQKDEKNDRYDSTGFGVHNLRATYKPQEGVLTGTEIRFSVENAFDRDYTPALSTRPAPGRNIKLSLARMF